MLKTVLLSTLSLAALAACESADTSSIGAGDLLSARNFRDAEAGPDVRSVQAHDAGQRDVDGGVARDLGPNVVAQCPSARNETPPPGGIYDHQVFRARSQDGLTFVSEGRVLIDHASVPDAVMRRDGSTWVYFVNGRPGQHGIWIARERRDGSFEIFDCVRLDGRIEGDAVDPDIVRLPDGRYRLFYFLGHFVTSPDPNQIEHPIYSAISNDGIHFKVERQVASAEDVTDPSATRLADGSWLLGVAAPEGTRLAASSDGQRFTWTDVRVDRGALPELVTLRDGRVRLYVATLHGLDSLLSSDGGRTWTVEPGQRLVMEGADPSLVQHPDGRSTLFYKRFAR